MNCENENSAHDALGRIEIIRIILWGIRLRPTFSKFIYTIMVEPQFVQLEFEK